MTAVYPFAAFSPNAANAPRVATLPYDVMNRKEAAQMAAGNPLSFLHVTRSEIDLPEDVHPYDDVVYAQAATAWNNFLKQGILTQDSTPAYYVYSLVMKGRRQTGIVAAASVDDYDANIIRKHEKTRKEKEDDRTRHISTLRAQTGPVFLTYRDDTTIDSIVTKTMATAPLFDFTAPDGIQHTGWRIADADTQTIQSEFAAIPCLYIADGHHRAASASRTRAVLAAEGSDTPESHRFLAVIFPAGQLKILAYNRLVFDFGGLSANAFFAELNAVCTVKPATDQTPSRPGTCCMYFRNQWWTITLPAPPENASPVDKLDVSILQHSILAPILGIDDPRVSKRIDFVGGIRGTAELAKRVDSGEAVLAFSMYPTSLEQLMDIADNEQIMPPKSTWFEPKLRDGLFVHQI